jgi:hypothetical protein
VKPLADRRLAVTEQENAPVDGLEGDPISQDQAALDAEQGGIAAPNYVSREDFVRMQSTYQQQIAGLQSKVDTGLNAIRRDTQIAAEERLHGRLGTGARQGNGATSASTGCTTGNPE